jgi:RHS repeat-associated protein
VLHQAGTVTLDGAGYTYDNAGNRTAKTNYLNNITEQYTYDPLYQLTQVTQGTTTTESYSYDAVGNRLSSLGMSPYAYNLSNELTSTPSATFTYDGNGNTATKTDSSGTTTYNWDFENRLTSVTLPATGGTVTFKYDPFGRRIQKSLSAGTTVFLYNGDTISEEIDASGTELASYTQYDGVDEPLAQTRAGINSHYQQDDLNSVTSLSSTSGTPVKTFTYDAFGNLTASTGNIANTFQYTGRDFDAETGLRYYRARYYDPQVGRFLSEDPIRFGGGINFYDYVENQPTNLTDAGGLRGGPKGPPLGVKTRCNPSDSCQALRGKIWLLYRMLFSHIGWDLVMPSPRGGDRHDDEIAGFNNALNRCVGYYIKKKCGDCDKDKQPDTNPNPQTVPPTVIPLIDPLANWLNDKLGYPFAGPAWDGVRRGPQPIPGWMGAPGSAPGPIGPPPVPIWQWFATH